MSNVSRSEMLVGVDIGTSKVVSIVAETRGNTLEVIGLGTHSSKGLKNGVVVDIDSTTTAIKRSIVISLQILITAECISTPVCTRVMSTPLGSGRLTGPVTNLT